jgi:hypothetical protein
MCVAEMHIAPNDAWRLLYKEYYYLHESFKRKIKREQYNSALICCVIANANRTKGLPYKVEDFMPREPKKKQSWQEQLRFLEAFTASYEGGE